MMMICLICKLMKRCYSNSNWNYDAGLNLWNADLSFTFEFHWVPTFGYCEIDLPGVRNVRYSNTQSRKAYIYGPFKVLHTDLPVQDGFLSLMYSQKLIILHVSFKVDYAFRFKSQPTQTP